MCVVNNQNAISIDFLNHYFRNVFMNKQLPVCFLTKTIENSLLSINDIVFFPIIDDMIDSSQSFEAVSTEFYS